MKRIDEQDLQRIALSKGATITHGGSVVNPGARRLDLARPPVQQAPMAPPAPAPAPPPPPDAGALVASAVRENGQAMATLTAALIREVRAQQSPVAQPITHWDFRVQRDPDTMYLTGITATATRNRP